MASRALPATSGGLAPVCVLSSHLVRCFPVVDASAVTCVHAPAGFGKTTALNQWQEMFVAAGRPVSMIQGRAVRESGSFPALAKRFGSDDRPVAMIDDADLLDGAATLALAEWIRSAPPSATVVLAGRSATVLPLARLRAAGRVLDIGPDLLRLSLADTAQLLAARVQGPVDMDWAGYVHEQSGGWPAGIMLGALARGQGSAAATETAPFARGWQRLVHAYFAEEVWPELDAAELEQAERLAILPVPAPASCTKLADDIAADLERLSAAGWFVTGDTRGAQDLRLDPLFRRALLDRFARRDPTAFVAAHRQVVAQLEEVVEPRAAIGVAQASGDDDLLAATLERLAERMCYAGAIEQVVALAGTLDAERQRSSPSVLMCLAWWWMRALDVPAAERLLRDAERAIVAVERGTLASPHEPALLRLLLRHRHAMLLGARDDMAGAEREARALLDDLHDDQPYLSCTMLAQLMTARRELLHFRDALRLEADTRRAMARAGSRFAAIALQSSVAPTLALQGRTATARAMLEQAMELAGQFGGLRSGLSALAGLPLAELCYDMGDLDHADALVDRCMPAVRAFLNLDQLFPGHMVRARVLAAKGQVDAALSAIEEAHLVALECGLPRMRKLAMAVQVELLLRQGRPRQAERAYAVIVPDVAAEPLPRSQPTRCQEAVALAWLRLQLAHLNLAAVRRVAHRWRDTVWRASSLRSVVQFELILAKAAALDGQPREARRHLREALTIAAEPGWTRLFLDEGDVIVQLLRTTYAAGEAADSPADRLAAQLLEQAGEGHDPTAIEGSSERLAPREVEVLALVSNGLLNREIGERLGLTEGTVKWYMQQIYDKLGVRRRPQAVTRARLLGLIG